MALKLTNIRPAKSIQKRCNRSGCKGGLISVVNSPNNGTRIVFSSKIIDALDLKVNGEVNILFSDEGVIFTQAPGLGKAYHLKKYGDRLVIYLKDLVMEFVENLKLDFSEKRVCVTLSNGEFDEVEYEGSMFKAYLVKGDTATEVEVDENLGE